VTDYYVKKANWKKATNWDLWVKSDSNIYYNKTSDKVATKLVKSDLG
jgi:hypothetical protein